MRLINADELLFHIERLPLEAYYVDIDKVEDLIKSMPTIEECKKGMWVYKDLDNFRKYEVVCSECGSRYIGNYDAYDEPYDFNFCPNCGADMREE